MASISDFSNTTLYENIPLILSEQSLRLWKFYSNSDNGVIHLELASFNQATAPGYTALSYVWGSLGDAKTLLVNGHKLQVSRNLYDFIEILRWEDNHADKWFWADQISMNQDNAQERNHQVGRMGQIYAGAQVVFAYLGPYPDTLASISKLTRLYYTIVRYRSEALFRELMDALKELESRAYWRRLWIVQELRLAREVWLWSGAECIRGEDLWSSITKIKKTRAVDAQYTAVIGKDDGRLICSLIDPRARSTQISLAQAFANWASNQCGNPRDKIFGLQALVHPEERLEVDYSISLASLVYEIHSRRALADWSPSPFINDCDRLDFHCTYIHKFFPTAEHHLVRYHTARSLHVAWCFGVNALSESSAIAWIHMVALLPELMAPPHRTQTFSPYWDSLWGDLRAHAQTHKQKRLAEDLRRAASAHVGFVKGLDDDGSWQPSLHRMERLSGETLDRIGCIRCGGYYNVRIRDKRLECETCKPMMTSSMTKLRAITKELIIQQAKVHGYWLSDDFLYHEEEWPLNIEVQ